MHQQLPASSYAGLPHAPTIQQVNNLGPVNPEPQSPINPALMAQTNQQQMQVIVPTQLKLCSIGVSEPITQKGIEPLKLNLFEILVSYNSVVWALYRETDSALIAVNAPGLCPGHPYNAVVQR